MSSWNYRVVKTIYPDGQESYNIYSVYYYDDDTVQAWSLDPSRPYGDTHYGLAQDLARMTLALDKPVLVLSKDTYKMEEEEE